MWLPFVCSFCLCFCLCFCFFLLIRFNLIFVSSVSLPMATMPFADRLLLVRSILSAFPAFVRTCSGLTFYKKKDNGQLQISETKLLFFHWTGKMDVSLSALLRLRIWSRGTVSAVPYCVSLLIPILRWIWSLLTGYLPSSAAASIYLF